MTSSILSSRANLIQTISCPSNTLSNIDSLTLISLSAKFVINLKSLKAYIFERYLSVSSLAIGLIVLRLLVVNCLPQEFTEFS